MWLERSEGSMERVLLEEEDPQDHGIFFILITRERKTRKRRLTMGMMIRDGFPGLRRLRGRSTDCIYAWFSVRWME